MVTKFRYSWVLFFNPPLYNYIIICISILLLVGTWAAPVSSHHEYSCSECSDTSPFMDMFCLSWDVELLGHGADVCSTLLKADKYFPLYTPISNICEFHSFHILPTIWCLSVLILVNLCILVSRGDSNYLYLMTNNCKHLFLCWLPIHIPSFVKCLFKFYPFLFEWLSFYY